MTSPLATAPPGALARVRYGSRTCLVRWEGDGTAVVLADESDHPAADVLREALASGVSLAAGGPTVGLDDVELLPPVANPSKVICVGLNYVDHAAESGVKPPEKPLLFAKFPNTLVPAGGTANVPAALSAQLDYEGELAVVIGQRCRDVEEEEALDYLLGYTVANDLSARDAQFSDGQWLRGKSADGFCPIGPAIVPTAAVPDPQALPLETRVNGQTVQQASTADMIFSVAQIVSYCSGFFTLEAGDLILTGTPPGVGFARTPPLHLRDGDLVEVRIDGLGQLTHRLAIAQDAPSAALARSF
jgi:2-keto-4-pentenoate hydratase/2-oxohepta-3-ene-1,7-dioic acid hydratase in catechol pathway